MKKINNGQLRITNVGETVTLKGFIANKRKMGELTFIDLRDRWGFTQLVLHKNKEMLSKESVIEVTGEVVKRKDSNKELPTGEIEVDVKDIKVLSLAGQLPFIIHDDLEAKEDTRLQHRFLDLRRPIMQKNIITRHKINKAFRDFLDSEEFLEIETPMLSKSTPEGARDFLVPTRNEGKFFALPQSPQLYKQLLMASGFEKYFQIVRAFRDEDSRKDRQPEFTQLDMEMSFVDEKDVQDLTERMLKFVMKKLGHEIKIPFLRMEYDEAIDRFGNDKPDLRFKHELMEVTKYFEKTTFNAFKGVESIKMIHIPQLLSKKEIKKLEEVARKNGAKGLAWGTHNDNPQEFDGPLPKFCPEIMKTISTEFKLTSGTALVVASEYEVSTKALGAVRVELNNMFNYADPSEFNFSWVVNWPMFEQDKEKSRMIAAHHPFTSPSDQSLDTFDTKPLEARARAYDVVLNGFELGGGSIRIFDKDVQSRMFATIGMSPEEVQSQFGFFMEAFKYGLPPHAGIALGIDRFAMILTNSKNIREVIAFPKNAKGLAIMEQSPSEVSTEQLDEYFIKRK